MKSAIVYFFHLYLNITSKLETDLETNNNEKCTIQNNIHIKHDKNKFDCILQLYIKIDVVHF